MKNMSALIMMSRMCSIICPLGIAFWKRPQKKSFLNNKQLIKEIQDWSLISSENLDVL